MYKLYNVYSKVTWRLRRMLGDKNLPFRPILWNEPRFHFKNFPSNSLFSSLGAKQKDKLNFVIMETEMISRLNPHFPDTFNDKDWRILMECQSRKQRVDHLNFMRKIEVMRKKAQLKQNEESGKTGKLSDPSEIHLSISENLMKRASWFRVLAAHRLKAPVIAVDCRYLSKLSPRGLQLTGLQLKYMVATNRSHSSPMRLFFVNFDERLESVKNLKEKHLLFIEAKKTPSPIVTSLCASEMFDIDSIVYLSPDAEEELDTVDDEKVYIIGGIVDRVAEGGIPKQASLETAQALGVRCARLPISKHIKFKSGTKFLTLPAVMDILQDVNLHGDWNKALERNIPVRNKRDVSEKNEFQRQKHKEIREFNLQVIQILNKKLREPPLL